jgi:hypothetical protein
MGMVKDITARFTSNYLQGLLSVLQEINTQADGSALPEQQRIYKLGAGSLIKFPGRTLKAIGKLMVKKDFWRLMGWVGVNGLKDIGSLPARLVPTAMLSRYARLPGNLGEHLRFSERGLRNCRWIYLLYNAFYQLELTRAQIPMQRLGKRIELLVAMAALCCHASRLDTSTQHIAELQAQLIKIDLKSLSCVGSFATIKTMRDSLAQITTDLESGECSMINAIKPQPFAHPWDGAR